LTPPWVRENGIRFLLVSGKPLQEPVAWYGPIMMNTQEQLRHVFEELRDGSFLDSSASGRPCTVGRRDRRAYEWHEDDVACLVDQEIHTVDKMPLVRVESIPAEIDCGQ
jgi:hypothetical protein